MWMSVMPRLHTVTAFSAKAEDSKSTVGAFCVHPNIPSCSDCRFAYAMVWRIKAA
jgi:hypothetical protein